MKTKTTAAALISALLFSGCAAGTDNEAVRDVFAMDTVMTMKAYGKNAQKALEEAEDKIMSLDRKLRRGSTESEIYAVNSAGSAEVSDETAYLVEKAIEICSETGGKFDISIAPVSDLWGFYSGDYNVPSDEDIAAALENADHRSVDVSGNTVTVNGGAQIDLGGIAKGYLSSEIMKIMSDNGIRSGIISLGGNVQAMGHKPDGSDWRIAIQDPADPDAYIGILKASDKAVITSGGYQRYFVSDGEVYHHIIDPDTGRPANSGVSSVTIVSNDGTLADALSTALFVMGLEAGTDYWRTHSGFDVIFVDDSGAVYITEGLEKIFDASGSVSVIKK